MILRPYQNDAVEAIEREWQEATSALVVMPTGSGKTQVFAEIVRRRLQFGGAMIIAHREELIWQAAKRLEEITGVRPGVEMADSRATEGFWEGTEIVVSTVQTQVAGREQKRMERFSPFAYATLIIDEAHRATADTYRKVIDHYRRNPALKVLGVTATPDRHDEEALGQIFEEVAFDYELPDAIEDGWLVPIRQRMVEVHELDYSKVRTTAGDFNQGDLAAILEEENMLHEIAGPTLELAAGRKTLVFASSVAHAERLSEILNRPAYGGERTAKWVSGKTPKDDRREMLRDYSDGKFQILVNVGVATEGFDEPGIQCVVMARPTKSRALYAQMAGRGTRALPGVIDDLPSAEYRRDAIAHSGKPTCEIIDFAGNAGKHKLVTTADLLGGNYSDEAIEMAEQAVLEAKGEAVDTKEALDEAEREIRRAAAEEKKRKEEEAARRHRHRRAPVAGRAKFSAHSVDPFEILDIEPVRERGWNRNKPITDKMRTMLEKQGIDVDALSYTEAGQLCGALINRFRKKLCTMKQVKLLKKFDSYDGDETMRGASEKIDQIKAAGWRKPPQVEEKDAPIPF